MNLFILHTDNKVNAMHHADKHVVKMPIEATQLLCTVMREWCDIDYGYKSTYVSHPVTRWVGASFLNFAWTIDYANQLLLEYEYRFDRVHATMEVLQGVTDHWAQVSRCLPSGDKTPHHLAVSPELKHLEPVLAYRAYYLKTKTRLFKWTKREVPSWIVDPQYEIREYLPRR